MNSIEEIFDNSNPLIDGIHHFFDRYWPTFSGPNRRNLWKTHAKHDFMLYLSNWPTPPSNPGNLLLHPEKGAPLRLFEGQPILSLKIEQKSLSSLGRTHPRVSHFGIDSPTITVQYFFASGSGTHEKSQATEAAWERNSLYSQSAFR